MDYALKQELFASKVVTQDLIDRLGLAMDAMFSPVGKDGKPDIKKVEDNLMYNMGENYSFLNALLMKETQVLNQIESDMNTVRAQAILDTKKTLRFELSKDGFDSMVNAVPAYNEKKLEYNNQKAFVDYLERSLKRMSYFSNTVKVFNETFAIDREYGGYV
jgi:hypothetical protein